MLLNLATWLAAALLLVAANSVVATPQMAAVDALLRDEMAHANIPGMAVAVSVNGRVTFYSHGVASRASGAAVTPRTLFEIGSLSKTFTATLAGYAAAQHRLDFTQPVSHYLPALRGSAFDRVTPLNLGTHTSGLPLQVPGAITTPAQLMAYYRDWQPPAPVGRVRVYSNPGSGLLGLLAAQALGQPFCHAMATHLFAAFGLGNTYLQVPADRLADYAQGYNQNDEPVRLNPGPLDAEAYGIKAGSADVIRYLNIQLGVVPVAPGWRQALRLTQQGYAQVGGFTQGLMWERYPLPVSLAQLLAGNDSRVITEPQPATALTPPTPPLRTAWYNKTGSTNGFSAYAMFIPQRQVALVILANHAWPNGRRVTLAWNILKALDADALVP